MNNHNTRTLLFVFVLGLSAGFAGTARAQAPEAETSVQLHHLSRADAESIIRTISDGEVSVATRRRRIVLRGPAAKVREANDAVVALDVDASEAALETIAHRRAESAVAGLRHLMPVGADMQVRGLDVLGGLDEPGSARTGRRWQGAMTRRCRSIVEEEQRGQRRSGPPSEVQQVCRAHLVAAPGPGLIFVLARPEGQAHVRRMLRPPHMPALEVGVVYLEHLEVREVLEVAQAVVGPWVVLVAHRETNSLVVLDGADVLDRVGDVLRRLDDRAAQRRRHVHARVPARRGR